MYQTLVVLGSNESPGNEEEFGGSILHFGAEVWQLQLIFREQS